MGISSNKNCLWETIQSSYNLKEIFSFLKEKRKLSIIIYNRKIQNKLKINIGDYMKESKKYKIGGENGKGSEYLIETNILIFEGKYLNGKRNGKGKEYYDKGKLKFEGEYLDGKRNGTGKEYEYDSIIFEGENLNGKRNGK